MASLIFSINKNISLALFVVSRRFSPLSLKRLR